MMNNDNKDYITCVYGIYGKIYISVFDPNDNYKHINIIEKGVGGQYIKSETFPPDNKKMLICTYISNDQIPMKCLNYDIETFSLNETIEEIPSICGYQPHCLNIYYFYETESFVVACKKDGNELTLYELDKDLNLKTTLGPYNDQNLLTDGGDIGRISIIFPEGGNKFSIYYHPAPTCNDNCQIAENRIQGMGDEISAENLHPFPTTEVSALICPVYYSYDHTACINYLPEGFYCNSTTDKILDRCHDNCKTCTTGPTTENNLCTTCKDTGTIYFDLGNCVSECANGYFTDNSIMKCKCSMIFHANIAQLKAKH